MSTISDNRAANLFQRFLNQSKIYRLPLKNIRLCGAKVNPVHNAVSVVTNGEDAKYKGVVRCHSPWACPHCTARVMAEKGTDIAAAIDALAKWYNQRPIMITLTMPHTNKMSCETSWRILRLAWRQFIRAGNRSKTSKSKYVTTSDRLGTGSKGAVRTYTHTQRSAYCQFRETLGITHHVRVYEATWSQLNGWHHHAHVLMWVPKQNLSQVLAWEDRLYDRWWECLIQSSMKVYKCSRAEAEEYYADWRKHPVTGHKSLFISREEKGRVRVMSSSHYISGWGGDAETTGEKRKVARGCGSGHYTPNQIIEMAVTDIPNRQKWLELYAEYALTTHGNRRVEFSSRSGIGKIINRWKQTEEFANVYKKKVMDKEDAYREVYRFSPYQWSCIIFETMYNDLMTEILLLAKMPHGRSMIENLLTQHDILLDDRPEHRIWKDWKQQLRQIG